MPKKGVREGPCLSLGGIDALVGLVGILGSLLGREGTPWKKMNGWNLNSMEVNGSDDFPYGVGGILLG